ncbi:hypothetical protein HOT49_gp008 [Erwinia phage vB_EamM_Alexandra]|uniref:Uncharacterized protein n=1 Tax=Erwinia phage vB_EamM_Alexandra TaxID=2201424 RepID=A0A2Z4QDD8_9CAUD|nr:hypothetical protein HOT49_gp008 [Erwinia phage vB_EamM_Alexandra]AWY08290.1 hypothetical protein Alexandra_8 [Erwinia phage vB_EamM_Alexandra]
MSGLFPHRIIKQKEGFVFIVQPADDNDQDSVEAAQEVENILTEAWPTAPSELSVDDVRDPEEAELIYADVVQLLEEAERDESNQIVIGGIVIVGNLVVVTCMLTGEDLDDEEEDEDDDSVEADEEDFA